MAKAKRSELEFVAATKATLRDLHLPEAWLERKIREDPSILELGSVKVDSFQRRSKKGGRLDLLLSDEENSTLYAVELMLGEADASHIVRCVDYWLAERRLAEGRKSSKKEWSVIAVLAAERVRESSYFPVIELLSQKIPLTVIEITGLKVRGYTTLNFAKIFDGQDQLEQGEGGDEDIVSGKDVNRSYWAERRPEGIMRVADSLAKIFQSADRQLRVTYLQGFWGFAVGEKPKNFATISPKQKFVNVRVRIRDTETWSEKLRKAGFEITGGTPRKSVRFRVTAGYPNKRGKLLRQLAEEAYAERTIGIQT